MDKVTTVDFELLVRGTVSTATSDVLLDAFSFDIGSANDDRAFMAGFNRPVGPIERADDVLTFGTSVSSPNGDLGKSEAGDLQGLVDRFVFDLVERSFTKGHLEASFTIVKTTAVVDAFQQIFDAPDTAGTIARGFEVGAGIFDPLNTEGDLSGFDFIG